MNSISSKDFFKNYGFIVLLILFASGILISLTFLSNTSWEKGLKVSVENVLSEESDDWVVGDNIEITSPMSTNACAFEIYNTQTHEKAKAVILRITTMYGPQSGVFIYHEDEKIEFVGYSSLHGRIAEQIKNKPFDKRLDYWQDKIPEILGM